MEGMFRMVEKNVKVNLQQGLQARVAADFVQKASAFNSDITLVKNDKSLAAKSIIGVMSAAIRPGEEITLIANGSDEEDAVMTLEHFLISS
jgi:phosphotransferase system HPr (HPr) family protein